MAATVELDASLKRELAPQRGIRELLESSVNGAVYVSLCQFAFVGTK